MGVILSDWWFFGWVMQRSLKISMGVRNGEIELKHRINRILRKHRTAINAILKSYNVPLVL